MTYAKSTQVEDARTLSPSEIESYMREARRLRADYIKSLFARKADAPKAAPIAGAKPAAA